MPETYRLLCSLGEHFLRRFITALFARDGHFLALLLAAIWGLKGGFTSLSVQGIFGSGKTYCASLMLIIATTVLNLPTLLTAEPNLPLLTAAENISDLLRDAPDDTRAQYARILAQNVPKSTSIDVLPVDRSGLFQTGSSLKCVLITQGSLLRNFCQPYSTLSSFMKTVRLAFNDESQQGGQAGYTVLGANLPSNCLQHKSGTGGEKIKEALHERLSQKAIGFLGGPLPLLPHELLTAFFAALRADESSAILMPDDHSPFTLFSALTTHPLCLLCSLNSCGG